MTNLQPNILAIDTSFGSCSVALFRGDELLDVREELTPSKQAESLVLLVEDILHTHDINYADLGLLVSTVGPGSFTGLRIGLTAVKGFALVTGVKSGGVTTLETCVQACKPNQACVVVLNAMRAEVYIQRFDAQHSAQGDAQLLKLDELTDYLQNGDVIVGNAREVVEPAIGDVSVDYIEAAPHATLAGQFAIAHVDDLRPLEPLYIRKPDAKLPKKVMV